MELLWPMSGLLAAGMMVGYAPDDPDKGVYYWIVATVVCAMLGPFALGAQIGWMVRNPAAPRDGREK
jgi:hypothetical protein